jgi:CubicO group peptidase (beta-lactamase class C family)
MARKTWTVLIFWALAMGLQSCLVGRSVWYNFADITDYKIFPSRALPKAAIPFQFIEAAEEIKIGRLKVRRIDSIAKVNNSVAFLIIRNDSLLFESYYQNYEVSSTVTSWSMAKSYTSALVGVALDEGLIKSVEDPIINYLPELKSKKGFDQIKVKHLLQMTSGIAGNESYFNPFGYAAKLYYGKNLRRQLAHLKIRTKHSPGTHWTYSSINTELLGLILERTSGKSITEYLNDKIWQHIGAEYDASWSIDRKKNGLEKTFCCLNAKARDFAKFGRLYLQKGNWNGKQILSKDWILESTRASNEEGGVGFYKYQWWFNRTGFFAEGILGQFIYVNPKKNLIIVRLGKTEGKRSWPSLFDLISNSI